MINIKKIRNDFPMLKTFLHGKKIIYFDNASTTFKPNSVINAINRYYLKENSNSKRGDYDLCYKVDQTIEKTRNLIANFIHAKSSKEIVFTSGTTMSINLIAFCFAVNFLKKGDEILLNEAEHASNVLPWYKVASITGAKIKFIPLDEGKLTLKNIKKVTTKKTKIIAFADVSNVLGYLSPTKEITCFAHSKKIVVICDAAQSIAHHNINVCDLNVDFLCFSAHKMYGPTGIGVLYGKYKFLEKMEPFILGGGMNDIFNIKGSVSYLKPPEKFEAGTLNIAGIYGFKAAIEYLNKIGMDNIENYEKEICNYAFKKLSKNKNIIIYNRNKNINSNIIVFNKKNVFAQDESTYLNSCGIAVRSGQHCAKLLVNTLKTIATIRISFSFYNTKKEIDKLVKFLNNGDFLDAYFD
ncbi:aminotransferase class V-fold PLP-dependent enzyme [bacterium]|nr:aminotransferase class V-fold PLP-dependent enzyme [bacterium]